MRLAELRRQPPAASGADALSERDRGWRRDMPACIALLSTQFANSGLPSASLIVARPGLLDQLDHRVRHRHVVEILGHLAALSKAQSKNLSASAAAAGSGGCLCIRMKVAPVIGQLSAPGWSVRIR